MNKISTVIFTLMWYFLNHVHTYVRTEVNYTEEVDDPVDSDGMLLVHNCSNDYCKI